MDASQIKLPFSESYWVVPGLLLAGEHPVVQYSELQTRSRLQGLIKAGIELCIDLTESDRSGMRYSDLLTEESAQYMKDVAYSNFPIVDFDIPAPSQMTEILDTIDQSIASRKPVYVHCFAGIGRTGTVVGCYLVRHGKSGIEALETIKNLRANLPNAYRRSPESDAQMDYVRNWKKDQ